MEKERADKPKNKAGHVLNESELNLEKIIVLILQVSF